MKMLQRIKFLKGPSNVAIERPLMPLARLHWRAVGKEPAALGVSGDGTLRQRKSRATLRPYGTFV